MVDVATDAVDEETETKDPEDDGGNAGEVVDANADGLQHDAGFGVFVEVDGGDDAERGHERGHEQGHDKGAEDGGKDAAFGVGFAGFLSEEGDGVVEEDFEAAAEGELVGLVEVNDLGDGLIALFATGEAVDEFLDFLAVAQGGGLSGEGGVFAAELGEFLFERGAIFGGGIGFAQADFEFVDAGVDGADFVFFESGDFGATSVAFLHETMQFGEEGWIAGEQRLGGAEFEPDRGEDGFAVFAAFGDDVVSGESGGGEAGLIQEAESEAVGVAVAGEDLDFFDGLTGGSGAAGLIFGDDAGDFFGGAVFLGGEGEFADGLRPEDGKAIPSDEQQEADDHEETDVEAGRRQPDFDLTFRGEQSGGRRGIRMGVGH